MQRQNNREKEGIIVDTLYVSCNGLSSQIKESNAMLSQVPSVSTAINTSRIWANQYVAYLHVSVTSEFFDIYASTLDVYRQLCILPTLQPTFSTTKSYYIFFMNSVSNLTPNKKDSKLVSTQKWTKSAIN